MKTSKTNILDQKKQLQDALKVIEANETRSIEILTEHLPNAKCQVLALLAELEQYNAPDDYPCYLMKVIESAGPEGVSLTLLRKVMPDTEALAIARAIHKDQIREVRDGSIARLIAVQAPDAVVQ